MLHSMIFRKKYAPVGSRAGTLVINPNAAPPNIQSFTYETNHFIESTCLWETDNTQFLKKLDSLLDQIKKSKDVSWIDIRGINHEESLRKIAEAFNLSELTLADIVNVPQRPKIEEQDPYLLIITSIPTLNSDYSVSVEQVSLILGTNFVLTFQEHEGDVFEPVRTRIRQGKGSIRRSGSDYLAYALIDSIIDNYFPILENIGTYLEEIEEELISNANEKTLGEIYKVKRTLLLLRRSIWPHREIFSAILRDEFKIFKKATRNYLRDVYDHTVELIDVVEIYRELSGGFMEIYLSSISNRLNDVMKILTIISTIFIPLSFIASLYGMNFEFMPELKMKYGYPSVLIFMLSIGLFMVFFFYRKGWLSKKKIETLN